MRRLLLAAVCFTQLDLNNAVCRSLCRQDGYDTGFFQSAKCLCSNEIEFEAAMKKRVYIHPKRAKVSVTPTTEVSEVP